MNPTNHAAYCTTVYHICTCLFHQDQDSPEGEGEDDELYYSLLSGEEENVTLGFLLARPVNTELANSPRRVCFTYLRDSNGTRCGGGTRSIKSLKQYRYIIYRTYY